MINEGIYDGEIQNACVEVDDRNEGELVLSFNIKLIDTGDIVTARHATGGKWGRIGRKVAESLDVKWPDGLETINETAGQMCKVKIKHKDSDTPGQPFVNAYIHVARESEPATPEQVKAGIAKLKMDAKPTEAKDDDIPF